MRLTWVVPAALLVVAACGGDDGSATLSVDDDAVAAFERAVELEGGVVPLIVDLDAIGATDADVSVRRTPDPRLDDVTHLVARSDDPATPLIGFTFQPDADVDLGGDGAGSSVRVDSESPPRVRVTTPSGVLVDVLAPTLDLDGVLGVLDDTRLADDRIVALPEPWGVLGAVEVPTWLDGHTTTIELADDAGTVFVDVEAVRGDRELLVRFGPTEPVDVGTGGWAYRFTGSAIPGYVLEFGDGLVASVTGDLTDEQFRAAIGTLREVRPGEYEIAEPAPWPPDFDG